MSSILVINAAGRETRVALVESGHIAEFYLERKKDKGIVGNIYKGRVVRVLPGMQAAFVDVGLDKAAFLYVSDVFYDPELSRSQFELTEGEHDDAPEVPEELGEDPLAHAAASGHDLELDVQELPPGELAPPEGHPARTITGEFPAVADLARDPAAPFDGAGGLDSVPASLSGVAATPVLDDRAGGLGSEHAGPSAEHARSPAGSAPSGLTASSGISPSEGMAGDISPHSSAEATPFEGGADTDSSERAPDEARGTSVALEGAQAQADVAETAEHVDGVQEFPDAEASGSGARVNGQSPKAAAVPDVRGERRGPRDQRPRDKHGRNREERRPREEEKPKLQRKSAKIEDLLKVGQEVLVQISKDPIGTKGARLTSHISIPGRHLVFMPTVDHVGISRRIGNEKERRRLRDIVDRLRPPGTGFIVRTVAENVPQEKLEADIRFLIEVWNETVRRNEKRGGAGLMHPDLDLILRATRDLFAQDVEKLIIDDRDEYERVMAFVTAQDPALKDRVILHDDEEPVFDAYGIEQEIQRAVQRKVWLKSGGYLIIDQAEALTAIDVNSGRYVGKKSLEETITKINMEAAKEIVYQLRLRNIGGIIICDFIDMEKSQNRDKVFKTLQEALGRDKAKTNVLKISELGLVEMTRKRVRESIGRVLHEDCSYCDGQGFVKTATTVCYEIFREVRREAPGYKDPTLVINCNGEVAKLLQGDERTELRHLMDRYNKSIQVKAQQNYHREQYDIYGRSVQGSEHKLASSSEVFDNVAYGAPKRPAAEDRGGGRSDRPGGGRDRGRGNDRSRGAKDGGTSSRDGRGEGPNREPRESRGDGGNGNRDSKEGRGNTTGAPKESGGNREGRGEARGPREGGNREGGGNRGNREARGGGGNRDGARRDRNDRQPASDPEVSSSSREPDNAQEGSGPPTATDATGERTGSSEAVSIKPPPLPVEGK